MHNPPKMTRMQRLERNLSAARKENMFNYGRADRALRALGRAWVKLNMKSLDPSAVRALTEVESCLQQIVRDSNHRGDGPDAA